MPFIHLGNRYHIVSEDEQREYLRHGRIPVWLAPRALPPRPGTSCPGQGAGIEPAREGLDMGWWEHLR